MAGITAGNRDADKGLRLSYYPPTEDGIVNITESDLEAGKELWKNAVIGQFLGAKPTFKEVVGFVNRAWRGTEVPRVHFLKPGIFLFNFTKPEAKKEILIRRWSFNLAPVIVREWSSDFDMEKCNPDTIPVWIKLPKLDLLYWSSHTLSKVVSAIGTPLVTDSLTKSRDKLSYARVLVDVKVGIKMKHILSLRLPGGGIYHNL